MNYSLECHLQSHGDWPRGFDQLGNRLQLPATLGNLPLFPEEDGWYSVLGPRITTDNPEIGNIGHQEANPANPPAPAPINPPRAPLANRILIFCENPKCSGNSGPHTCARGKFTCKAPNCPWPDSFPTKQAFNRHYQSQHSDDRVDCPVPGCVHVGDRGIKRADNLAAHLLSQHGISRARPAPPHGEN